MVLYRVSTGVIHRERGRVSLRLAYSLLGGLNPPVGRIRRDSTGETYLWKSWDQRLCDRDPTELHVYGRSEDQSETVGCDLIGGYNCERN